MAPPSSNQPYSESNMLAASCRECGHSARYNVAHLVPAEKSSSQ